jgi:hypothetical protein
MAKKDEKPMLTQDLKLPPGNVVTPDHIVVQNTAQSGFSDRRLNADGSIIDLAAAAPQHLSTYEGAKPALAEGAPEVAPATAETQPGAQG